MSTAHDTLEEFVNEVTKILPEVIKIPNTNEEYEGLANEFYKHGYPNVIGAIDGSGIDVVVPQSDKNDYFTRKYRTSLNLSAVCDARKKIWYINVGQSERCHDSHIFRCSSLGKMLLSNTFPSQYHLIGDAAYGLHINMIVPFPGPELSDEQQTHNTKHSSTRMAVERLFSDLKSRWIRLKALRCEMTLATKIIAVCCVLHNLCINNGDIAPTNLPPMTGSHVLCVSSGSAKIKDIARHLMSA